MLDTRVSARIRHALRRASIAPRARRRASARAAALAVALVSSAAPAYADAWAVGHRVLTWSDPARGGRSVATDVYYPAEASGEGVAVAVGSFPVLAFGHGYLMPPSAYAYLWEALVPAGYVFCLPRTEGSLFPDHDAFGKDLAFVIGRMRAESVAPGSAFFERIAPGAAVMGHSMGGGASFLAAAQDGSITALANLAAAETNPSAIAAAGVLTVPALLFAGAADCVTPPAAHQVPMYEALASVCKSLVTLEGASHCQFAASNFTCSLGEGSCPAPGLTRAAQQAAVLDLLLPWLDAFLRDDASAFLLFQQRLAGATGAVVRQNCAAVDAPHGERTARLGPGVFTASPQPFREAVELHFEIGGPRRVRIEIHDVRGRFVRRLEPGELAAGRHTAAWDGRDDDGRPVAAGWYFLRMAGSARTPATPLLRLR